MSAQDTREIRARILDPWGNPVPGAALYLEAWIGNGEEYDFAFARAGAQGEIPAQGAPPVTLEWRPGARLAYLAIEQDHQPVLIFDRDQRLDPGALEFTLQDLHPDWRPDLRGLAYPFDDHPGLARKLEDPRYATLRALLEPYLPSSGVRLFRLEPGARQTGSDRPRLFLSARGQGAACAFVRARDGHHFVQVDGRVHDGHDKVLDVVLSPDGKRFAFTYLDRRTRLKPGLSPRPHLVERDWPVYVNLDGARLGPFSSVYHLGFSDDGRQAWFSLVDLEGGKGVWSDGQLLTGRVTEIDAAEDGSFASWLLERNGQLFVYINGRALGGYDRILRPPVRTPDGSHVWFRALAAGRVVLWVDGRELGPFEETGEVDFPPGSDSFRFTVRDGARTLLYADGQPRGEITSERWPLLRPDGSVAGQVRRSPDRWFVDLDHQTLGGFSDLGPIRFSPDGARFGFGFAFADEVGYFMNLGGKVMGLARDRFSSHGDAVFSGDLTRGAFAFERAGLAYVLLDGHEIAAGEGVTQLGFSPDSRVFWFLSYAVRDGLRRYALHLGDQVLGDYEFADPPVFSEDGRRSWFRYTQKGEEFIHAAGADHQLAPYLGDQWVRTSPDRSRWAFSYVQDYPANQRRLIHLDGRPGVYAIEADPDHSGFAPHALALLPAGGAALLTLDPAGFVRRLVLGAQPAPGTPASPAVQISLPKREFAWGEPVPLTIALRNPKDSPVVREDPARSPKTLIRLVRLKDGKRLSLALSGSARPVTWNGRDPYPVPALTLAPGARLEHRVDLLERLVLSRDQAAGLRPGAGDWECYVQDRGQESGHLVLRLRLTRESVPLLLATLRDRAQDPRKRAWAMSWLRAVVEPHVRGFFTEAPWELASPADQARAERELEDQLARYQRWWTRFGATDEAARWLESLQR